MREPTLFHVKTFRYDAWFLNSERIWFVLEGELDSEFGSHRRDNALVVSKDPPVYTSGHGPWDQNSPWAPPTEVLPDRVKVDDEWYGWWTDDLNNVRVVSLSDAPLPVYRAFWDRVCIETKP